MINKIVEFIKTIPGKILIILATIAAGIFALIMMCDGKKPNIEIEKDDKNDIQKLEKEKEEITSNIKEIDKQINAENNEKIKEAIKTEKKIENILNEKDDKKELEQKIKDFTDSW